MKSFSLLFFALLFSVHAIASPLVHADAKKLWEQSKKKTGYEQYSSEFAQFNNSHRLDEKNNCYALNKGPVIIYLVIKHSAGEKYAAIAEVVSDVDNSKTQCFRKTYLGVPTKPPPFVPFVLQMKME